MLKPATASNLYFTATGFGRNAAPGHESIAGCERLEGVSRIIVDRWSLDSRAGGTVSQSGTMQLALNPEGRLIGTANGDADEDLSQAFALGSAHGLLAIAAVKVSGKRGSS